MPAAQTTRRASATAPGTCGELAQEMLDGIVCMVTCPIDLYSTATVQLSPGEGGISAPADSPKARRAVQATLDYLEERGFKASLRLDSPLPRGKGMASSTADVSASIVATVSALGREISPPQIAEIALSIEPSDGVMFHGVSIFDHREGKIARVMGNPPPMYVVILDFGGSIDTLAFNREDRDNTLKRLAPEMAEAVSLIEEGVRQCDPVPIGRGATMSAIANQQLLPNAHFEEVVKLSEEAGAVGVNIAHSGTVIGMLFADAPRLAENASSLARQRLGAGIGAMLPPGRRWRQGWLTRLWSGYYSKISPSDSKKAGRSSSSVITPSPL